MKKPIESYSAEDFRKHFDKKKKYTKKTNSVEEQKKQFELNKNTDDLIKYIKEV
jgi:hypothetical protein